MVELRQTTDMINAEIGQRLNVPTNTVGAELGRMRALGFEVSASPYHSASRMVRPERVWTYEIRTLAQALLERGHEVPALAQRNGTAAS